MNEIMIPEAASLQKYSDKDFDAMASSAYLPRLQLMTSSSDICKTGAFPINHYALINGQNHTDVGLEVDALIIAWRPKAMKMADDIVVSYNPNDDLFRQIQQESETKDSGCMYGPEFLVFTQGKFATFFLGSKSARKEGQNVRARLGQIATLKSKLIEWKAYKWQAPVVIPCNSPFDLPSTEAITEEVEKFNNPPVVAAPEKAQAASNRAR